MSHHDARLRDLEDRLRRDDPQFASAMADGRPQRPREYRHGWAWLMLAVGLAAFAVGIVIGHGLLIATGLVVAGAAGHLFDPERGRLRGDGAPVAR